MKVRFLRPARNEYVAALEYYTAQSPDLGVAFLEDLESALQLLAEHPYVGAAFEGEIRRVLLRRFHHSLIYGIQADEVVIHAVQHQSRHPESWRKNL